LEEAILDKLRQLPPGKQEDVLRFAEGLLKPPLPPVRRVPYHDRSREMEWVRENEERYAELWVAVEGDRLILADRDAVKVYEAAKAEGIMSPFLAHMPPRGQLPFGGW
jgi:hypothetical protein